MLKELRTQHRNIVQMSFNGFKNGEIAEKTGMTQATISQILRSPLGKAYLNGLIDRAQENTIDVRKQLIDMNKDALSTLTRLLDPKVKAPHNVQLSAAKDVLDRNGYKASDKFEIDVFSHKSDDEIEAEIRAMEAAVTRNQITAHSNLPGEEDTDEQSDDQFDLHTSDKITNQSQHSSAAASTSIKSIPEEDPDLPADLQEKLADLSFNPFQNIPS